MATTDFEARQLLKAYRKGLISDELFEEQMQELRSGTTDQGYSYNGKSYETEKELVLGILDEFRCAEDFAAEYLNRWVEVSDQECVKGGLRVGAAARGLPRPDSGRTAARAGRLPAVQRAGPNGVRKSCRSLPQPTATTSRSSSPSPLQLKDKDLTEILKPLTDAHRPDPGRSAQQRAARLAGRR